MSIVAMVQHRFDIERYYHVMLICHGVRVLQQVNKFPWYDPDDDV
jgi:hypothetical protein